MAASLQAQEAEVTVADLEGTYIGTTTGWDYYIFSGRNEYLEYNATDYEMTLEAGEEENQVLLHNFVPETYTTVVATLEGNHLVIAPQVFVYEHEEDYTDYVICLDEGEELQDADPEPFYLVITKEGDTITLSNTDHYWSVFEDTTVASYRYVDFYNGVSTFVKDSTPNAIESIETEQAPLELYNLQGVRVNGDVAPGVYVRRQGNNVTKVMIGK